MKLKLITLSIATALSVGSFGAMAAQTGVFVPNDLKVHAIDGHFAKQSTGWQALSSGKHTLLVQYQERQYHGNRDRLLRSEPFTIRFDIRDGQNLSLGAHSGKALSEFNLNVMPRITLMDDASQSSVAFDLGQADSMQIKDSVVTLPNNIRLISLNGVSADSSQVIRTLRPGSNQMVITYQGDYIQSGEETQRIYSEPVLVTFEVTAGDKINLNVRDPNNPIEARQFKLAPSISIDNQMTGQSIAFNSSVADDLMNAATPEQLALSIPSNIRVISINGIANGTAADLREGVNQMVVQYQDTYQTSYKNIQINSHPVVLEFERQGDQQLSLNVQRATNPLEARLYTSMPHISVLTSQGETLTSTR
ncbi:DUF2057 family protein [Dongshaea marina]|uniref:DUF2057 family protein n=1 Tax=Dongshaea marina TaxID=2047966 RepID=UPI00131F007C|nr:DUF2057 family protein [Dongshaea marina]